MGGAARFGEPPRNHRSCRARPARPPGGGFFLRRRIRRAAQIRRRHRSVAAGPVPRHLVAVQTNPGVPRPARRPPRPDRRAHHHAFAERAGECTTPSAICASSIRTPAAASARWPRSPGSWNRSPAGSAAASATRATARAGLAIVEADGRRLKFNPLAALTAAEHQRRLCFRRSAAPSAAGRRLPLDRLRAVHQPRAGRRRGPRWALEWAG